MENNKEIPTAEEILKNFVEEKAGCQVIHNITGSAILDAMKEYAKLMLEAQGNYIAKKMSSINMTAINFSNDFINQNLK